MMFSFTAPRFVIKAGHKYISRERKGNKWVYTYAKKPGAKSKPADGSPEAAETIGSTLSGKPVFAGKLASDPAYANFSLEDHVDAKMLHLKHRKEKNLGSAPTANGAGSAESERSSAAIDSHQYVADDAYGQHEYADLPKDVTARTKRAVSDYLRERGTIADYRTINKVLRGDVSGLTPQHIERAKDFGKLIGDRIAESPIKEPITLYRSAPMPENITVGQTFRTPSLLSTSESLKEARSRVAVSKMRGGLPAGHVPSIVMIHAPAGVHALDVNANYFSPYPDEKEHILGSNQALRVTGKRVEDGIMHIEAEAIPHETPSHMPQPASARAAKSYSQAELAKGAAAMPESGRLTDDPGFIIDDAASAARPAFKITRKGIQKAQGGADAKRRTDADRPQTQAGPRRHADK